MKISSVVLWVVVAVLGWIALVVTVLLLSAVVAGAQQAPTPIGPSSWQKPDGRIQRAMGPGGAPVLNYQKNDGSWDFIVDDWVQVGGRQVWKSVRGNHRVFADSTGAAIYAKGNHYLGISPGPLVKFDKSDSTWVTLKPSLPDSVSVSGRTITFHNVYPGIDLRLVNNAKVLQRFSYQVVFHQQARDSLAAWGPWTGYLLGTATKLNIDSLNLTLRDAAGVFGITTTGRMVDEWVSLGSADTSAFYLSTAYLQTEDSATNIPVRKWLVRFAGSPWLVELFDPIPTGALPPGDLWHNATFGNMGTGGSGALLENRVGGSFFAPSSSGTVDSVTGYITNNHVSNEIRFAVLEWNGESSDFAFLDTTTELSLGVGGYAWRSAPAQIGYSVSSGTKYTLLAWGSFGTGSGLLLQYQASGGDTLVTISSQTYSGNGWSDITPLNESTPTLNNEAHIYCTYTEGVAGEDNIIPLLDRRPIRGVGRGIGYKDEDSFETFAGALRSACGISSRLCD